MTYLKKLSLRAAVSSCRSGQITVWLSLSFLVFFSLYLACLGSVQKQHRNQKAEQAVEAGIFSLFSEFEPHLLEDYDLLCLDTSFRSGRERQDELCSHLWNFTQRNMTGPAGTLLEGRKLQGINVKNLVRMTDDEGAVFYNQAIRIMKEKTGASLAEDWMSQETFREEAEEDARRFQEDCETYEGTVENYESEDEEEELDSDARQWDGLRNRFTRWAALPDTANISDRALNLERCPSRRSLSEGTGRADGSENSLIQKQWFISYLSEYFTHAQEMLKEEREGGCMDYQMEYVLCGKASDRENLEQVIQEILMMREGVNYVFLLTHPEYSEKAEALAGILGGVTGSVSLVKSLQHLILLGWACGESLVEVRQLLGGYELSMVKTADDWQVPLSGLLELIGNPGSYDEQRNRQEGMDYESYLRILLSLKPWKELAMRSLDIIEGELRLQDGCEKIHLDHCVEKMTAQVWMEGIYLERTYGYE